MRATNYIESESDNYEPSDERHVWILTEDEDEYDVELEQTEDDEWQVSSIESVIADIPIKRRDKDQKDQMRSIACDVVQKMVEVNS